MVSTPRLHSLVAFTRRENIDSGELVEVKGLHVREVTGSAAEAPELIV